MPETTPEIVYPALVLVLALLLLLVEALLVLVELVALVVDEAELPLSLHAARDMQAKVMNEADKRVNRIMNVL